MFDFARLSRAELQAMAECGRALLAVQRDLDAAGSSVLAEALQGAAAVYEWQHYPTGDIHDPVSHAQYFYHAHPPGERKPKPGTVDEHGHFHTFLRQRGMPAGVRPMVMPELAIADNPAAPNGPISAPQSAEGEESEPWSHLVAIAMDASGVPLRFFTTNRWVTGETWFPAPDVVRMLERFVLDPAPPSPLLNRWMAAMLGFYKPLLADLVVRRDAAIMEWRRRHRAKVHVFDDLRLEVTSSLDIDLQRDIAALDGILRRVA